MGSIDKEEMGMADCSIGLIVWVRRRNGSWWPGKILGSSELAAANLVSPRTGTPVKLLGREDASVDWYNLEKSKRVKPFRCGEFDECIERAEAALGMPPRKREKYARREDAILHALELEKQLFDDKNGNLVSLVDGYSNKSSGMVKKEPVISSKCSKYDNFKPGSKNLVIAARDEYVDDYIYPQKVNGVSQMGEDVKSSDMIPRVSGLSKRKLSSSPALNASRKSKLDSFHHDLPIGGLISDNTTSIRGSLERKRKLPNAVLKNESLVKRHDRRRPLVQVLQKSEKSSLQFSEEDHIGPPRHTNFSDEDGLISPIPMEEPPSCVEEEHIGPTRHTNFSDEDKLISPLPMEESPSCVEVVNFSHPANLDEEIASESTESTETDSSKTNSIDSGEDAEMAGPAEPAFSPNLETKSLGISEKRQHRSMSIDFPHGNDMSTLYPHNCVPASLGVSKWQIKGKRNKRNLTRRSTEATDRWVARGSIYTTDFEEVEDDGFDETGCIERGFKTQWRSDYNQRLAYNRNIINWENLAWNEQPYMNHLVATVGSHRFGGSTKIGLLDVDLKVQSSYQREHVPLISLRSKLNGKAIVGHPIQVEILEDGSTNSLLSSAYDMGLGSTSHFQNANHNRKMPFNKLKKGIAERIISKNPPKKTSVLLNQKIKTLSAIGREHKLENNFRSGDKNSFQVSAFIKGEVGPTTVACIPVKLVFSRLNEELVGRHQ